MATLLSPRRVGDSSASLRDNQGLAYTYFPSGRLPSPARTAAQLVELQKTERLTRRSQEPHPQRDLADTTMP
jgi:hypothetical protein